MVYFLFKLIILLLQLHKKPFPKNNQKDRITVNTSNMRSRMKKKALRLSQKSLYVPK